jgi:hypothetical protein
MVTASSDLVILWLEIQIEQSRKLSREFHEFLSDIRNFEPLRREERGFQYDRPTDSGAEAMPSSFPIG